MRLTSFSDIANKRNVYSILLLVIVALISIALSGKISYWNPEYSNMDFNKYIKMAEVSPSINSNIPQPFVFRIIVPWLAGILPFSIATGFYLMSLLFQLLFVILLYHFLVFYSIEKNISFALTVCFIFNRYFFQFFSWDYFQAGDVLSNVIVLTMFFLIVKKKWLLLSLIFLLGIFVKETVLLILPLGYFLLLRRLKDKKDILCFTLASLIPIIIFVSSRILMSNQIGENLVNQFIAGVSDIFTPKVFIKKFIVAFTPFGLIPIIFPKEILKFIRERFYLFIYFVGVVFTSFFGDLERLMAPSAPVYFLLMGFIVQSYLINKKNPQILIFIYTIILISFLSSFYHLWGVFQLPNKNITIILTIVLQVVTALLFFRLKMQRNKINHSSIQSSFN